jgi:hypothetical protein
MTEGIELAQCPPEELAEAMAAAQVDDEAGLEAVEGLIEAYGLDPRLHFLRGSILAGLKRYDEGRLAMAVAVDLAPGFAIARFQLGFLALTSGDAETALAVWAPLGELPADHPLRLFATGLEHLIRDEFEPCIARLREGMALNTDLPPVNHDMQLIIERLLQTQAELAAVGEPEVVSARHLLLQEYRAKTKH